MKSRLSRPRASRGRREPFGKAGLILAVFALVLACTGGAFAAGKLTGPQKKEVGKIAAKVAKKNAGAGKPGPKGATGPAGPAGAPGAAGAPGTAAAYGVIGPNGANSMTFKQNVGFTGEPSNPQPGVTCVPAPKQGTPLALTLGQPGIIYQVVPNQCGGNANYEVVTEAVGGGLTDLTFNIVVP